MYYMLNHRIRGFLFHYKKNCYFAIGFYFLVRVFRNTLIPSVKMTLTMNKMFAGIICQTIEREVDFSTAKKKYCYFGFYFLVRVFKTSWFSFIRLYSPCCKPVKLGHYCLRSKRFRRVWEQRKTEERGFRYFAFAKMGREPKKKNVHRPVILCSRTAQKRLLRRLRTLQCITASYFGKMT